jgi:hypothetical protein
MRIEFRPSSAGDVAAGDQVSSHSRRPLPDRFIDVIVGAEIDEID